MNTEEKKLEYIPFRIKLTNDHIVIDDEQCLIVDTGSPMSFHTSGQIILGEHIVPVSKSIIGISTDYLSQKVGCEIHGIIGMDIIRENSVLIDVKTNYLSFNGGTWHERIACMNNIFFTQTGLLCLRMFINNRMAKMIVDTGAKISYIKENYVADRPIIDNAEDFSPFVGEFQTPLYLCETEFILKPSLYESEHGMPHHYVETSYEQKFGIPPYEISLLLDNYNVDGIIGMDLFKRYRIQIYNGKLYFPPQGI